LRSILRKINPEILDDDDEIRTYNDILNCEFEIDDICIDEESVIICIKSYCCGELDGGCIDIPLNLLNLEK